MTGAQLKGCVVPGTVSLSIALGKILLGGRGNSDQLAPAIAELFDTSIYGVFRQIFSGTVADMSTHVVGGYDVGRAVIESQSDSKSLLVVDIKNEYLVARLDGNVLASVPDLLTILDYETAQPINAERLRYGQRVSVFAIGCPGHYRTADALKVVSPRCFGFDFDYVPLV